MKRDGITQDYQGRAAADRPIKNPNPGAQLIELRHLLEGHGSSTPTLIGRDSIQN